MCYNFSFISSLQGKSDKKYQNLLKSTKTYSKRYYSCQTVMEAKTQKSTKSYQKMLNAVETLSILKLRQFQKVYHCTRQFLHVLAHCNMFTTVNNHQTFQHVLTFFSTCSTFQYFLVLFQYFLVLFSPFQQNQP